MKDLVERIAKHLVNHPEQVKVENTDSGNVEIYELTVADEDRGQVIGKNGKNAQAFRTILNAAGAKQGKRVFLEIVE